MYLLSKNKSECCGCEACHDVCPKNAITMSDDGCGFLYPEINKELCVNCGLCEKACPLTHALPEGFETKFYAVRSKDDDVVDKSSSGGMLTLMAEEIFSRGGVVYGVVYGEGFRVEHARAENMEQAKAFRTSKYVQSDTEALHASVKKDLEAGKPVLVTGTPCQIAGLQSFVKHARIDDSLLYTCDNICHGVSSPLTFKDYMSILQKYIPEGDRINYLNMRHKRTPGENTVLEIRTEKHGVIREVDDFSYYRLFLNRIANRPSCFNCHYTSYARVGDYTVADFWNGTDSSFTFDGDHGVNEVLINTDKGQELFDAIRERAFYQEVTKEMAWQPHLEYTTQKPKNYEQFWEEYLSSDDREQVMRKYLKVDPLFKVINFATPILRKIGLYSLFGRLYKAVFVKKK